MTRLLPGLVTFHVGVQLHPQATSYVEIRDAWRRAESLGVDSICEYGFEFGTAPDRLRKFRDDLPRLGARLAALNPAPLGPLPILIGGSGEKVTLELTAQHADAWNSFGPPERFAQKNTVLSRWREELGRDPSEIERTVAIDPDAVGQLDAFLEAGATHVIVMTGHPYELGAVEALIARRDA